MVPIHSDGNNSSFVQHSPFIATPCQYLSGHEPGLPRVRQTATIRPVKKPAPSPATATVESLAPGLRRFLYATAALTGAAILIVEILGAKILAPYLGTSHFVWTAQISITLIALACGYYAGGWWVDRAVRPGRLYTGIMVAGIYLAATSNFAEPVAYECLKFRLALGSLLASGILFFIPLSLLAMTGPFLIRVLTTSINTVGGSVGRLTSISTLGSVVGAVLIGYVLIPRLPNSVTMLITSGVLMLLTVIYFLVWGRRQAATTMALAGLGTGLAAGYMGVRADAYHGNITTELFRCNSNFGRLQVLQRTDYPYRALANDFLTQNTYDTERHQSASAFTYLLHGLAQAYTTNLNDVLCIGLGVGIVPMTFANDGARVDAVEINPAVVPVAERYFDLQTSRLNLFLEDGRCYLHRCHKQYDAVILDAFIGDSPPSHLMTREAFASIRNVLKPGGTLVINTFGNFDPGRDFMMASLQDTLQAVFKSVRIHGSAHGNVLFVASIDDNLEMVRKPDFSSVHPLCATDVRLGFDTVLTAEPAHGLVLTDDYNPVDFRDAANREEFRRNLARAIQSL